MNSLLAIPKKRSLAKNNIAFPTTSWLDDFLLGDFPSLFSTNFNEGISVPKVNIKETSDAFLVEMAVPGLKKSDFNVDVDDHVITISTEVKEEKEEKEDNYTRREFGYTSFKRAFTLPENVDESKIEANYKEGILNIVLPKMEEAELKSARNIEIS